MKYLCFSLNTFLNLFSILKNNEDTVIIIIVHFNHD